MQTTTDNAVSQTAPRQPADFSRTAVQSHVRKAAIQHPAVLYPGAVGLLGGLAALVLEPSLIAVSAAIGGLSVAGMAWVAGMSVFREYLANQYARRLLEHIERQRELRIEATQKRLKAAKAVQGESQFNRLRDKFDAFKRLLDGKLKPGELTHTRYIGMGEQVYLAVLDNLDRVSDIQQSVQAIDEAFIAKRLKQLEQEARAESAVSSEKNALKERAALLEKQHQRVTQLYAENEQAMTKLDNTLSAISEMTTGGKHASLDLETAMQELQRLAEQAQAYSE